MCVEKQKISIGIRQRSARRRYADCSPSSREITLVRQEEDSGRLCGPRGVPHAGVSPRVFHLHTSGRFLSQQPPSWRAQVTLPSLNRSRRAACGPHCPGIRRCWCASWPEVLHNLRQDLVISGRRLCCRLRRMNEGWGDSRQVGRRREVRIQQAARGRVTLLRGDRQVSQPSQVVRAGRWRQLREVVCRVAENVQRLVCCRPCALLRLHSPNRAPHNLDRSCGRARLGSGLSAVRLTLASEEGSARRLVLDIAFRFALLLRARFVRRSGLLALLLFGIAALFTLALFLAAARLFSRRRRRLFLFILLLAARSVRSTVR